MSGWWIFVRTLVTHGWGGGSVRISSRADIRNWTLNYSPTCNLFFKVSHMATHRKVLSRLPNFMGRSPEWSSCQKPLILFFKTVPKIIWRGEEVSQKGIGTIWTLTPPHWARVVRTWDPWWRGSPWSLGGSPAAPTTSSCGNSVSPGPTAASRANRPSPPVSTVRNLRNAAHLCQFYLGYRLDVVDTDMSPFSRRVTTAAVPQIRFPSS